MRVLDLFSGIGGFSLGLERAGMQTVAFCEVDPFCRRVLAKHWPGVPIFEDVRALKGADVGAVDLICGGFPCQDISLAGRGAGLAGARSGLWSEYRRVVEEKDPDWVVIENVAALRSRGPDEVLGALAALGFDAEWHCIPASAVGAPHRRDRIWIVAHAARLQSGRPEQRPVGQRVGPGGEPPPVAHAPNSIRRPNASGMGKGQSGEEGQACGGPLRKGDRGAWHDGLAEGREVMADAYQHSRIARRIGDAIKVERRRNLGGGAVGQGGMALTEHSGREGRNAQGIGPDRAVSPGWWLVEPDVGRVAHGVPARVDRLRSLGNAVVPQIPEMIGRAIMQAAA